MYGDDGRREKDALGRDRPRPPGLPTPCSTCPKVDASPGERRTLPVVELRARAVELTPQNWQAFEHDRECRAVGRWPNDPVVRRNAAIIAEERESHERRELQRPLLELVVRIDSMLKR